MTSPPYQVPGGAWTPAQPVVPALPPATVQPHKSGFHRISAGDVTPTTNTRGNDISTVSAGDGVITTTTPAGGYITATPTAWGDISIPAASGAISASSRAGRRGEAR